MPRHSLSNSHFSTDYQSHDVLQWLKDNAPKQYEKLNKDFEGDLDRIKFDGASFGSASPDPQSNDRFLCFRPSPPPPPSPSGPTAPHRPHGPLTARRPLVDPPTHYVAHRAS